MPCPTLLVTSITLGLHATAAITAFICTLALLAIPTFLLFACFNSPTPAPPTPQTSSPSSSSASNPLAGAAIGSLLLTHLVTTLSMAPAEGGIARGSVKSALAIGTVLVIFLTAVVAFLVVKAVGDALIAHGDKSWPAARGSVEAASSPAQSKTETDGKESVVGKE